MAKVKKPKYTYKQSESRARNQMIPQYSAPVAGDWWSTFEGMPMAQPTYSFVPQTQQVAQPANIGTGGVPTYTPISSPTAPMPGVPSFSPVPSGPPQAPEYAPTNTAMPSGGSSGGYPDYNYWYDLQQNQESWSPEQQAQYLATFYGQRDEQGNLTAVGNPRFGDPYQVMPYWKYDQPTWVGGREGGASSMGRGRMPSRYYIPKQEFYKTKGGKTYASREGYEDALGIPEDDNKKGNNNMIPLWAGPLVNWRK